ncbi:DUF6434 domain-containing protein [Kiloniella antarctica]|uniref:DUF6434 domain-containing protein n=1 Tax=Kiloniella antarctica TaxID=1550907 RepID=A0ABW5BLD2_9PROT
MTSSNKSHKKLKRDIIDWHCAELTRATPITDSYKNTQNVRRFLRRECGENFKFTRPFMAQIRGWIQEGAKGTDCKTLGDVADEWNRREKKDRIKEST